MPHPEDLKFNQQLHGAEVILGFLLFIGGLWGANAIIATVGAGAVTYGILRMPIE